MQGFGSGMWGSRRGGRRQPDNPNDPQVGIEPWLMRPQRPNYGPFNGGALPQPAQARTNPFGNFFSRFSQALEGYSSPFTDMMSQYQASQPQMSANPFSQFQGFGSFGKRPVPAYGNTQAYPSYEQAYGKPYGAPVTPQALSLGRLKQSPPRDPNSWMDDIGIGIGNPAIGEYSGGLIGDYAKTIGSQPIPPGYDITTR